MRYGHNISSDCNLPADNADVVCIGQLLLGGVGIPRVHVVDGPTTHDDVIEGLLESTQGQVHRPDGKQRQRVNPNHDHNEEKVEQNLKN